MSEKKIVEKINHAIEMTIASGKHYVNLMPQDAQQAANLIESQQREIVELSKDKERLDWLAHRNYQVQLNSVTNRYEIKPCSHYDADNIRQAIDAARKEQPK